MGDDRKTSPANRDSFERRLQDTRKALEERDRQGTSHSSAYTFGFRLATDLIAGVLGGFAIGWLLDYWLGTSPGFLLAFTALGMAAGVMNVIRAAKSAEARRHLEQTRGEGLPRVEDDED